MHDPSFRPFLNMPDKDFYLSETSTGNLKKIDMLKLRATVIHPKNKERLCAEYCIDPEEHIPTDRTEMLPKDKYSYELALVLFEMSPEDVEKADPEHVDFAEVNRALGKYENAGNEELMEQVDGLNALNALLGSTGQNSVTINNPSSD